MPSEFGVLNEVRQTKLVEQVAIAGTSNARRTGLLRFREMPAEFGLWIAPCEAIHTIGMKFSIDVVFLDRGKRVVKLVSALKPWRVALCLRAHSVLELQAGAIDQSRTMVGDQLRFQPI